jgi:glycosyltransferase involved in cell wall biosynthesis
VRIILLHNIVNPHMTPAFEHLASLPGVELEVAYFAETEGERRWPTLPGSFRSHILPGRQINLRLAWDTMSFHVNPGLERFLAERAWDVMINSGWSSISHWQGFRACRKLGRPHVLWAGSTEYEPSLMRTLTGPLVRYMVRHSQSWVSYGTTSARYLVSLGADDSRVVRAYHCIDNARFAERCAATREAAEVLRRELGERPVVLFVGRLVERKGCDVLLQACARLEKPVTVVIAGDGVARAPWTAEAARLGVDARFVGDVALDDLPRYYQAADLFVLPSLVEVWGLVLNEAALAGLPLVATRCSGAAEDLIVEGENGTTVTPGSVDELAAALDRLLSRRDRLVEMGVASRRIAERCSPEGVGEALARAARLAVEAGT